MDKLTSEDILNLPNRPRLLPFSKMAVIASLNSSADAEKLLDILDKNMAIAYAQGLDDAIVALTKVLKEAGIF